MRIDMIATNIVTIRVSSNVDASGFNKLQLQLTVVDVVWSSVI